MVKNWWERRERPRRCVLKNKAGGVWLLCLFFEVDVLESVLAGERFPEVFLLLR